jgi:hypothetical protein
VLTAYRRTGADPPGWDVAADHGSAMEGHFWRLTHAATGRVVVVIAAPCDGGRWAMVTVARHPEATVQTQLVDEVRTDRRRLGLRLGDGPLLEASPRRLRAPGVDVELRAPVTWPKVLGGMGAAHVLPGLSQYWSPHTLRADAGGGWRLYAEKNWAPPGGGMAAEWWWGEAHDFADRDDACVAFAGGPARWGPVTLRGTALVVELAGEVVRLVAPPQLVRASGFGVTARGARWAVELEGEPAGPALGLPVPLPGERRVAEAYSPQHLAARLAVRVRRGRRLVWAGESVLAGLERVRPARPGAPPGAAARPR